MRLCSGCRYQFLGIIAAAFVVAGSAGHASHPVSAAVPVIHAKSAQFWRSSAVAVVRITAAPTPRTWPRQLKRTPMPVPVHVLAVLATEKTVKTEMGLLIYLYAGDCHLQGPIYTRAPGTYLVCMTFLRRRQRWGLPGDIGPPFLPHGLESAKVSGLSDPLVKKVAATVGKLIARALSVPSVAPLPGGVVP